MSDIYTWQEVEESGDLDGYEPHRNSIDAQVVAELKCENCGCEDCIYHGMKKGDSYRAFSECPVCGDTVEF